MSDTLITALATVITAIIGAATSIAVAKITSGKKPGPRDFRPTWMWIFGGFAVGAGLGLLIAVLIIKPRTVIDSMNTLDGWVPYKVEGNDCQLVMDQGHEKQAIEIIYYLVPYGYAGLSKIVDVMPPDGTQELSFYLRGQGSSNMLEVKIIYPPDAQSKNPVFSYDISNATPTNGWVKITIPYKEFRCWPDTGCRQDEIIVPSKLWKIDFAISTKNAGQAGVGAVAIDQIEVR
jgi:hypothetical protein